MTRSDIRRTTTQSELADLMTMLLAGDDAARGESYAETAVRYAAEGEDTIAALFSTAEDQWWMLAERTPVTHSWHCDLCGEALGEDEESCPAHPDAMIISVPSWKGTK